jgi:hypothetical protein
MEPKFSTIGFVKAAIYSFTSFPNASIGNPEKAKHWIPGQARNDDVGRLA